jgi:hypothetical protein
LALHDLAHFSRQRIGARRRIVVSLLDQVDEQVQTNVVVFQPPQFDLLFVGGQGCIIEIAGLLPGDLPDRLAVERQGADPGAGRRRADIGSVHFHNAVVRKGVRIARVTRRIAECLGRNPVRREQPLTARPQQGVFNRLNATLRQFLVKTRVASRAVTPCVGPGDQSPLLRVKGVSQS